MAIVVESTASNSALDSTTLTITKPSGLTVGDFMVVALSSYDATVGAKFNTLSGWTSVRNDTAGTASVTVQYKVADSSDVAASNFTWTGTEVLRFSSGAIMRLSGVAQLSPVEVSATANEGAATSTDVSLATSLAVTSDNTFLLMLFSNYEDAGTGTMSAYDTVGATISWNELYDFTQDYGTDDPIQAAAYGTLATAATITGFGGTTSTAKDNWLGSIVAFVPSVDATGTNTLATATATALAQTGSAAATAVSTLATATSAAFTQDGVGTSPTPWSNQSKNTSTWTNQDKS